MIKSLLIGLTAVLFAFTGCGNQPEPLTNITNNQKAIVSIDLTNVNSEAKVRSLIVKALNKSPKKCTLSKKSKHLLFDIYYTDNCSTTYTSSNTSIIKTLSTNRKSMTKTVGGDRRHSSEETSTLIVSAPLTISKNSSGFHITIDGVNQVRSSMPDGVDHYYTSKEFAKNFNEELYIMEVN